MTHQSQRMVIRWSLVGLRSDRRHPPGFLLITMMVLLAGCGGTQLTPEQQQEYTSLEGQLGELNSQMRDIKSKSKARYDRLGRLEKAAGVATSKSIICGTQLSGQSLGPLPFRYKARYRVAIKGKKKARAKGRRCVQPGLKVVR